jgi:hypothetical protein
MRDLDEYYGSWPYDHLELHVGVLDPELEEGLKQVEGVI